MRSFKRQFVITALCSFVVLSFFLVGCSKTAPPDDDSLIENFNGHRSDFETLVTLSPQDSAPEANQLVDKLRLHSVRFYEDSVLLTAYVSGLSPEGGVYKGYEYFPHGLPGRFAASVVDDLEYDPKIYEPGTWLRRKIDENWYLFLLY
jgi:hypothetical protein